ncbi:MAG: tRNA lysidine(34) synthetase TilS [Candidatus Tectomicrobia bacterium]|nr:tRNA lysidine(34) synthetase TilS [Candidatus Tectomicrobia bacterium]
MRAERLLVPGETVIVAVSGGPDSMALLEFLAGLRQEYDLRLVVAHVTHGFRPAAAEREATFVAEHAARCGAPCVVETVDAPAFRRIHRCSPQVAARTLRYQALRGVQKLYQAQKLAVGHNADDQAETVLLRLLRGTGLRGLRAMQPRGKDGLIRPLLGERRAAILAYLQARGIPFLEDPSNALPHYLRNRIRHHLLPLLEREYQPKVRQRLLELAQISQIDEEFLSWHTLTAVQQLVRGDPRQGLSLPVAALRHLPLAVLNRVILWCFASLSAPEASCGAAHVQAVRRLINAEPASWSGGCDLPGGMRVWRAAGDIWWRPAPSAGAPAQPCPLPVPGAVELPHGRLQSRLVDFRREPRPQFSSVPPGRHEAWIDQAQVRGGLRVRTRRPGDRIQPLGMQGTVSLKELFINDKVPRHARDRIPLVIDDETIIWVVGGRLHHAYRITPGTQQAINLSYLDAEGEEERGTSPARRYLT